MNNLLAFDLRNSLNLKAKEINFLWGGVFIGLLCFILGFVISPERVWVNYLVNLFYFVSLALFGTFFLALHNVVNASWSSPIKAVAEGLTSFLLWSIPLGAGLYFGAHTLYEWTHHEVVVNDHLLSGKMPYLNMTGFILRSLTFLIVWFILSKILVKLSNQKVDQTNPSFRRKQMIFSVLFLVFFSYSYCFISYDWIMSIEPHWFSTIFGVYTFSGLFVSGLAVLTLMLIVLQSRGHLRNIINRNHYHDLGKYIFGMSCFWAYIWFSQYMLIWYSNIPEETMYYYLRLNGSWDWLFYFNLGINWLLPFFFLLSRDSKRSKFVLFRVCILLIIGRWLDIYLMVAPNVFKHAGVSNPQIGWIEIGMGIGFGSFFALVISKALTKGQLVHDQDPFLEEGLHLHQ